MFNILNTKKMKTKTENNFLRIAIIRKMKKKELTVYAISKKRTGISNQTIREYLKTVGLCG